MTFLNVIICIENKLALNYTKDFKLFERQNQKMYQEFVPRNVPRIFQKYEIQAVIKFILTRSMNHSTILP